MIKSELDSYITLANEGNVQCQIYLGWLYSVGADGVSKNYDAAKHWLRKARDNNEVIAIYLMGTIDFNEKRYDEAIAKFIESGEAGISSGYYQLGKMYYFGFGVIQDRVKGIDFIMKASDEGHMFAKRLLVTSALKGELGLLKGLVQVAIFPLVIIKSMWLAVTDPKSEKLYD